MAPYNPIDSESDDVLELVNGVYFHNPYCAQLNRGLYSGHPMGDHSRRLSYSLVLLMLISILVPLSQPTSQSELSEESSLNYVSSRSSTLIDVPDWRIGDEWVYDAEFDVAGLLASGGITGASVSILTGELNMEVVDLYTDTIDNVSTLVYERESTGFFSGSASIPYSGFNVAGDLEVDFELYELIRVSDLSTIAIEMTLDVDLENIGGLAGLFVGGRIDLATLTILTEYSPPKEIYDFPLGIGQIWDTETTTSTSWSGDVFEDLFPIPDDTEEQSTERFEVISMGDPGVAYAGCSGAYNVTSYNASSGEISGYRWWCPNADNDAWWHQTIDIGADIDFRLKQYNQVSRVHEIEVDLSFPAWPLDSDFAVWVNVSNANGQPVSNQDLEFRYEIEEDIRTITTASNGSAYVVFDTGHELDPSPTNIDYASHGVIAWIPSTEEIGVSSLTLDENLVEVDLVALVEGVSVSRTRGGITQQLTTLTGYNSIPGDELTFSVPVQNRGILSAPATILEVQAPDGSTSQVNVPALGALGVFTVDVSWVVPQSQSIGDVTMQFVVDPLQSITEDADYSNNQGSFSVFVGRLPSIDIASLNPKLTFENIAIDASMSSDPDGGSLICIFDAELENGTMESTVATNCILEKHWKNNGEYVVNLTIYDDEDDSASTSVLVVVNNRPAVVNLTSSDSQVKVGEPVTFSAQDNSDIDTTTPDAPIDMLWTPPNAANGQPYSCSQGLITQSCTVTPEIEGIFTMSFRAVDDDFAVTTESISITVTNIAPYNASIQLRDVETNTILESDSMGIWYLNEDQPVELLGFVEDSPNDLPTMQWEWQPDSSGNVSWFETTIGPTSVVPVSWAESGYYSIAMQAFDDDGETSGTVSAWVVVNNVAPTISSFDEPLPLWEDSRTLFTLEYNDSASDMDSLEACWDLDPFINLDQEGSSDDDCDITGPTLNHKWSEAGIYSVIFHVTDNDGESTSQMVNFTVRNRQPVADIWVSTTAPKAGEMFGLSGNLSTDTPSDQQNLVYRWDLDTSVDSDGDTDPTNDIDEIGMEIWVTFDNPGQRGIRLMVSDEIETSTKDYTVAVLEDDSGFLSFGGGSIVSSIVIIMLLVLAGLLGVLAWTSLRSGRDGDDAWNDTAVMGFGMEQEAPVAAPPSAMFAEPTAQPVVASTPAPAQPATSSGSPPVPAEGLPPGWTMEQWDHYGAQWLAQQAPQSQPTPTIAETPFQPVSSAEDDLDLDF